MGRNQQVLLVDADAEYRTNLKRKLASMAYAVVGEAQYGVEASQLAAELHPDIVLVHIEEPLALAFRTLRSVQRAAPAATPVVISSIDDTETVRTAMLAGARGYVVGLASDDDLDRVLSEAYSRHRESLDPPAEGAEPPAGGVIVTVFGPKGGVGKTTIATNLAVGLRRHTQARVALVDIDHYFGDVAIMMGVEPERTLLDLTAAIRDGGSERIETYLTPHSSGVDLLPAPHAADDSRQPTAEDIAVLLRRLARSYDFVVVDTPGAFSPLVAAALDEAATVLMVTSADMASIKDVRVSLGMLRGAGFDPGRLKLVVNHATNANSVSDDDVAATLNYDVFWTMPHDRAVPVSTQDGEPVLLSNPNAKMARRVDELAMFLCGLASGQRARARRRFHLLPWRAAS